MRKIGHHPGGAETVEGWSFRRCPCGFVLALSQTGRVWWVRAKSSVLEITSLGGLLAALSTSCRVHEIAARPKLPRKDGVEKPARSAEPQPRFMKPQPRVPRVAIESKPTIVMKPRARVISKPNG